MYLNKFEDLFDVSLYPSTKNTVKNLLNKRVYYSDYNGTCRTGILKGVLIEGSQVFYVIQDNKGMDHNIPESQSLTEL